MREKKINQNQNSNYDYKLIRISNKYLKLIKLINADTGKSLTKILNEILSQHFNKKNEI